MNRRQKAAIWSARTLTTENLCKTQSAGQPMATGAFRAAERAFGRANVPLQSGTAIEGVATDREAGRRVGEGFPLQKKTGKNGFDIAVTRTYDSSSSNPLEPTVEKKTKATNYYYKYIILLPTKIGYILHNLNKSPINMD